MEVQHGFYEFEDFFPSMMAHLGEEGFIGELCNGFHLLMDVNMGVITFDSLKRSSFQLGLEDIRDDEIVCMLLEGDLDGDGALNQMEFCILMFRLSQGIPDPPEPLMEQLDAAKISTIANLAHC